MVKSSELEPASREERALGAAIDTITHNSSGVTVRIRLNKSTSTFGAMVNGAVFTDKDGDKLRAAVLTAIEEGVRLEWLPVIEVEVPDPRSEYSIKIPKEKIKRDPYDDDADDKSSVLDVSAKVEAKRYYIAHVRGLNWRRLAWDKATGKMSATAKLTASESWTPPVDEEAIEALEDALSIVPDRQRRKMQIKLEAQQNFALPFYSKPDRKPPSYYRGHEELRHWLPYDDNLWRALIAIGTALATAQVQVNALVGSEKGVLAITAAGANIPKLLGAGK